MLNDPNLPRGGPGRSPQGTAALTEFAVEAEIAGKARAAEIRQSHGRLQSARDSRWTPFITTSSNKHRVIGPVSFAIDGKDETAWATDGDPGRRNLPHQAVFTLDKPLDSAQHVAADKDKCKKSR